MAVGRVYKEWPVQCAIHLDLGQDAPAGAVSDRPEERPKKTSGQRYQVDSVIFRALVDPSRQQFDLLRRQSAAGFGRRHSLVGILGRHTGQHAALVAVPGNDRRRSIPGRRGSRPRVQTQFRLAMRGIMAVAGFSFIVQEPSGIMEVVKDRSFFSKLFI